MTYEDFKVKYNSLNKIHKNIVFNTLRRLEHENVHEGVKPFKTIIKNKIKDKRIEKNIGYEELYELASAELESSGKKGLTYEAYQKMLRCGTVKSKLFKPILKVLEVEPKDVMEYTKEFNENFRIMAQDSVDLKWLYKTLSDRDRNAIEYLVWALYMEENHAEVFEDDEN